MHDAELVIITEIIKQVNEWNMSRCKRRNENNYRSSYNSTYHETRHKISKRSLCHDLIVCRPTLIDRAMLGTIRGRYGTPVICYVLCFACRNISTSLTGRSLFHAKWQLKSTSAPQQITRNNPYVSSARVLYAKVVWIPRDYPGKIMLSTF